MEKIENNIELINSRLAELLIGGSFDKFSYSGIYTMTFTLSKLFYGFNYCNLDIATEIAIKPFTNLSASKEFSIEDYFLIWGKVITNVKLDGDLCLNLIFENEYSCKISSHLEDPEGLFDMRWTIYQNKESGPFTVWVSDEETIYLKNQ
jgi:hypothetical protein